MKKTMGEIISENRKAKGLTQLELAEKLGITDKAVSKWERDLSCPDIATIPLLAEVLGVSIEELMQIKNSEKLPKSNKISEIFDTALKGIGVAMGIAVAVLSVLNQIDVRSAIIMLGIGLGCVSISLLDNKKEK